MKLRPGRLQGLILLKLTLLSVVGCATRTSSEPARSASRLIRAAGTDDVMLAAQDVLQREFGRVTREREAALRTAPVEFSASEAQAGGTRELLRPTRLRRHAWCAVTPREDGALVRLRVDVERQEVRRQPDFANDSSRRGDSPGTYSAIQEYAATTPEQNSNWVFVQRDSRLERSLLDQIEDFFVPDEAGAATRPAVSASAPGQ